MSPALQRDEFSSSLFLIPVNGLANRMRAIVSGLILARNLRSNFCFSWPYSDVMSCHPSRLFSSSFMDAYFMGEQVDLIKTFESKIGPYFFEDTTKSQRLLAIAGGRLGEQRYMQRLFSNMQTHEYSRTQIIIKSGGLFHLCATELCSDCKEFRNLRREVYEEMGFSSEVLEELNSSKIAFPSIYGAVHLRLTDKTIDQSVSRKRLVKVAVKQNRVSTPENSMIFVCGDDDTEVLEMSRRLEKKALNAHSRIGIELARSKSESAIHALVDWILLSRSKWIVYFTNTSFSYEASVFGGNFDKSIRIYPRFRKLRYQFAKLQRKIEGLQS